MPVCLTKEVQQHHLLLWWKAWIRHLKELSSLSRVNSVPFLDLFDDFISLLHQFIKPKIFYVFVMLPRNSQSKLILTYHMLLGFYLLFFVFQYLKNYIHLIHDEVLILVKEDTQIIVPSYKYPNQSIHSHIKGNPLVFFLFFHHVILHSKLENHLIRLLFGLLELFRHFTRGSQLILDSILIILNVIDLILQ